MIQKNYALAVAQAVREAILVGGLEGDELDAAMPVIIAAVTRPEPYCWKVDGMREPFFGEYAEIEAKHEAKRIGGTCKAFPLYTEPPAPAEPVNARLLDEVKELLGEIYTYSPLQSLVSVYALDDLRLAYIAAAEQQQAQPLPELSDEELATVWLRCPDFDTLQESILWFGRELRGGK